MLRQFNSNARKLNRIIPPKVNAENLVNLDLTGSLQNIELPTTNKFNSNTRSNPNPIKVVNNKTTISNFHQEILEHSARYVSRKIDEFDNTENTLTIYNVFLEWNERSVILSFCHFVIFSFSPKIKTASRMP
jgi:hypothetical protein